MIFETKWRLEIGLKFLYSSGDKVGFLRQKKLFLQPSGLKCSFSQPAERYMKNSFFVEQLHFFRPRCKWTLKFFGLSKECFTLFCTPQNLKWLWQMMWTFSSWNKTFLSICCGKYDNIPELDWTWYNVGFFFKWNVAHMSLRNGSQRRHVRVFLNLFLNGLQSLKIRVGDAVYFSAKKEQKTLV